MIKETLKINGIPAVIYGEKSDRAFIFVHGKCGCKEEGERLAGLVCKRGYQVLAFDLPGHGERKGGAEKPVPPVAVPEFRSIYGYAAGRWQSLSLHATSIGAYFSLLAFGANDFERSLLVSPVLDMQKLIENMMTWSGVTAAQLEQKGEISTDFGEDLSWEYYVFAKSHPLTHSLGKTSILYAGHDDLTSRETVTRFAESTDCSLTIFEDGEHWFHTDEQLKVWEDFVNDSLA